MSTRKPLGQPARPPSPVGGPARPPSPAGGYSLELAEGAGMRLSDSGRDLSSNP